ncbi:hypothetical protein KEM52_001453, partial [Ascosphaera acerosa]
FVPRSWVLDEVIERVRDKNDAAFLRRVLHMALHPFDDAWGVGGEDSADMSPAEQLAEQQRLCGDPPRLGRKMMCSCSS